MAESVLVIIEAHLGSGISSIIATDSYEDELTVERLGSEIVLHVDSPIYRFSSEAFASLIDQLRNMNYEMRGDEE